MPSAAAAEIIINGEPIDPERKPALSARDIALHYVNAPGYPTQGTEDLLWQLNEAVKADDDGLIEAACAPLASLPA